MKKINRIVFLILVSVSFTLCGGGDSSNVTPPLDLPTYTGEWDNLGGPIGGLGYDVRIDPNDHDIMYVTDNYAGVGKSLDGGATWFRTNSGIDAKSGPTEDSVPIFSLTIDPNDPDIIWAGTDANIAEGLGVYNSTDGGATWTLKDNGISKGEWMYLTFRGFTIEPGNSDVVYAQTEVHTEQGGASFEEVRGRIFKTIDGGENWSLVWDGNALTRYLIIDPENTDTLYVSTGIFDREAYDSDCANDIQGGVGVLKSTDGGQTWAQSNNGLNDLFVGSLRMHPTNHNILFAATGSISCSGAGHMGLYKTTNGGTSWTQVIDDAILTTVNFSLSNPSTMYAGGYGGFFKSTDGGTTWTEYTRGSLKTWGPEGVNGGFPIDVTVHPDDPDLVYVNAYGGGVLRSTDGTQTWELWSNGFSGAILYDVEVPSYDSSTVYAIGRSGPFKSTDYGETWTGIANYDHIANEWMTVATHPDNPDLVFISIEGESIVYRSDDGGTSFEQIIADDEPESGIKSFAFAPSDPEVIYGCVAKADLYPSESYQNIAHGKGLYKSTDGGQYFSLIDTNLTDVNWRRIVVDPDDADTAYAATSSGLYKTTDGGTHWTRFAGLGDKFLADVIIDFDNDYFVVSEMFGGVYVSDDAGVTWTGPNNTGMNSGNPYVAALVFDPEDIDIIYAAETYSGVYQSTDQGLTWSPFPDDDMSGLDYHAVKDIVITDAALYVATQGAGVFRYVRE